MVFEGPIVTVIAGFLASLGYFNLFLLYPLAVLGDLVGDTFYYSVGRWGGRRLIKRWGKYLPIKDEDIFRIERLFHKHGGKTLVLGKIVQVGITAVLVSAGLAKMRYWKFLYYNAIVTLPKSLLFVLVGFYFGRAYNKISNYLDLIIFVTLIILVMLFFILKKKIAKFFYEDLNCE
jgi:membrane protein DedA with SNARE-associated domain